MVLTMCAAVDEFSYTVVTACVLCTENSNDRFG